MSIKFAALGAERTVELTLRGNHTTFVSEVPVQRLLEDVGLAAVRTGEVLGAGQQEACSRQGGSGCVDTRETFT